MAVYLLLAACAACDVVPGGTSLRDQSVPIGITSRYSAASFGGAWQVRGAYPLDAELREVSRVQGDAAGQATWSFVSDLCQTDGGCQRQKTIWQATSEQPGADLLRDPAGGPERRAVVIWMDEGARTAAVGDPDGTFAWVLDRKAKGGSDRIRAARQVLAFNGFDLSGMEMRP